MSHLVSSFKFYGLVAGIAMTVSIASFVGNALQLPQSELHSPQAVLQPTLADGDVPVRMAAVAIVPTVAEAGPKPSIVVVDPPMGTASVWRIVLRGEHWGPFNNRMNPEVFLVSATNADQVYPMKVDRNYRDCTFKTTNDSLEQKCVEELFLVIEFTDVAKLAPAGDYLLYVQDESGHSAIAPFMLIATPDLSKSAQPTMALTPNHGPIGSYVVVSAGGFTKRSSLLVRLDGVKIGGTPITDENGFFTDVGIVIPRSIQVNGKTVALTTGTHMIEILNTASMSQSVRATFTIDGPVQVHVEPDPVVVKHKKQQEEVQKELNSDLTKEKQLEKQKELLQKETLVLTKKQIKKRLSKKDEKKLDALRKDQAQKQQELFKVKKNIEDTRNEKEAIDQVVRVDMYQGKTCGSDLPITFQPGCIPATPPTTIERPFAGKVCRTDMAITFQSGCVPGEPIVPVRLYEGKPCDSALPRVWQEGCIEQKKPAISAPTSLQSQKCSPLVPEYAQKGCVK